MRRVEDPAVVEAGVGRRLSFELFVLPGRWFSLLFRYVQMVVVGVATNPLGWYPIGIPKLKACSSGTV